MTGRQDKSKSWGTDKVRQKSPTKRGFIQEKGAEKHEMRKDGERMTGRELLFQPRDGFELSYCENKEGISER